MKMRIEIVNRPYTEEEALRLQSMGFTFTPVLGDSTKMTPLGADNQRGRKEVIMMFDSMQDFLLKVREVGNHLIAWTVRLDV